MVEPMSVNGAPLIVSLLGIDGGTRPSGDRGTNVGSAHEP
jgi:hypothetical protein